MFEDCEKIPESKIDEDSVISTTQIIVKSEEITDGKSAKKEKMQSGEVDSSAKVKVRSKSVQLDKGEKPKPDDATPSSSKAAENLTNNMQQSEHLESSIDRVLPEPVPVLKKFREDQLNKLTRSKLEEVIFLKICEAIMASNI
uniref:Uncharacterized protein n=1 Tax=Graphocephala atropunctata TaxID=36148 RepID=A0A1B6KBT9_9HEMI